MLFIFNPLAWSLSEAALSDTPSMFFGVLLAWLCFRARNGDVAFLIACIVASVAIGIRQPNVALLPLLAFPVVYRFYVGNGMTWRMLTLGAQLFLVATLAWFVLAVMVRSRGFADYLEAVNKQWTTAVSVYDITNVGKPWILNIPYRVERFLLGYFFICHWAGIDAKTPFMLLLALPWLFGFSLYVTSFNIRDPKYKFDGLWLGSIIYTILAIHFLPRYVLPQLPAFGIAVCDTNLVIPCWDNQTHSFYEAITPEAPPIGYWSMGELHAAYNTGQTLLVSDRCTRFDEIESAMGLVEVAEFSGDSPLWAKTPRIRLYKTINP